MTRTRPAVFFDRDNTLIAAHEYLGNPDDVRLIAGAADAVARLRQLGFAIVTASNQSGVARGYFDEAAVAAVNARMDQLLRQANPNAIIDRHEYCPFHPDAVIEKYRQDSNLRKPKPGMLLRAANELNLDLSKSWMIGDAPRDIAAGQAAGCRTSLFHDPARPPPPPPTPPPPPGRPTAPPPPH
jgi:D-glycero-D-manno-heptose 1,7-bisphosphate phosphatase